MRQIKKSFDIKNTNYFIIAGFSVYLLLSNIDRFICKIPDYIYIPIAIMGMTSIIIGIVKTKNDRR